MRNGVTDKQIKALALAMAGATFASVATMFLPVAVLETVTGSTGISELLPAAAAPLGDTARAMIAFGIGALTLAVLGYILPRQSETIREVALTPVPLDEPDASPSLKERLAGLSWPKMPWTKSEDDITELSDLPKLRNGDIHPDAPARRPLSAHQDLPVMDLKDLFAPQVVDRDFEPEQEPTVPQANSQPMEASSTEPIALADAQPTLAEMVQQLEAAVADRQKQLAQLEAVAAQLATGEVVTGHTGAALPETNSSPPEAPRAERPQLEAVPASPKDEDIDSALAAALATLHRMNGTAR